MSDRILAGVRYYGRCVAQVDDATAIVSCEGCGHADPCQRTDHRPLDAFDLNRMLLTPCRWCGGRKRS